MALTWLTFPWSVTSTSSPPSQRTVTFETPADFKPFYHGKTPYTGNGEEQTGSAAYTGGATGV